LYSRISVHASHTENQRQSIFAQVQPSPLPTTPNGNLEQHGAALADGNETHEHFTDSLTLPSHKSPFLSTFSYFYGTFQLKHTFNVF